MDRGRVVASGTPTALRGSSVELDITFSDEAIAEAALALIVAGGGKATRCGPTVIVGGQGDPETLSRRLWQAGLFPTELKRVPRRLEETFFELTSDSNNADR
jgi:hypothetical protein